MPSSRWKLSNACGHTHTHTPLQTQSFLFFPVFLPENSVKYDTQLNKPAISELIKQQQQKKKHSNSGISKYRFCCINWCPVGCLPMAMEQRDSYSLLMGWLAFAQLTLTSFGFLWKAGQKCGTIKSKISSRRRSIIMGVMTVSIYWVLTTCQALDISHVVNHLFLKKKEKQNWWAEWILLLARL